MIKPEYKDAERTCAKCGRTFIAPPEELDLHEAECRGPGTLVHAGHQLTTHGLAAQLLALPDLPVYVYNADYSQPQSPDGAKAVEYGDVRHMHTGRPTTEDADKNLLPTQYVMVW